MNLFKILLIDDEIAITESLSYALEKAQFSCTSAQSLQEADQYFQNESFHLVILDLTLGDGHGFDWLRKIRQYSQTPVLILSSHDDEVEHIVGLELGADDYINKPFSPREVVARVRAVLRRTSPQHIPTNALMSPLSKEEEPISDAEDQIEHLDHIESNVKTEYESIPLMMNKEMYMAWVYGAEMILSHLEFELLYFLYQRPQLVFSRYALLDRVWGDDVVISERTVDVHIKTIRKKLIQAGLQVEVIETIRGVGYKYILNKS